MTEKSSCAIFKTAAFQVALVHVGCKDQIAFANMLFWFPCCTIFRVAFPFNKVLRAASKRSVVQDFLHFVFTSTLFPSRMTVRPMFDLAVQYLQEVEIFTFSLVSSSTVRSLGFFRASLAFWYAVMHEQRLELLFCFAIVS